MLRRLRSRKGQSAVEYAAITIIVIGAFLAVQNYAKRGIQGRWKQSVDQMGDQYDPRVSDVDIRHVQVLNTDTAIITVNTVGGYWTTRRDVTNSVETKTGFSQVGAY
jgi:hypothetical protein